MRSDRIVMPSPLLDQHLGLVQRREQFTCQQLVAELGVEALAVAVLPRAARLDEERLHADPAEPLAHVAGNELGPIVRPNVLRRPVRNEQIGEAVEHVVGLELARHDDRQAAARELVDHRQHAKSSSHPRCDPARSRRTTRDWAAPAATGCTSRR